MPECQGTDCLLHYFYYLLLGTFSILFLVDFWVGREDQMLFLLFLFICLLVSFFLFIRLLLMLLFLLQFFINLFILFFLRIFLLPNDFPFFVLFG